MMHVAEEHASEILNLSRLTAGEAQLPLSLAASWSAPQPGSASKAKSKYVWGSETEGVGARRVKGMEDKACQVRPTHSHLSLAPT